MFSRIRIFALLILIVFFFKPNKIFSHGEEIGPYILNGIIGYQYGIGTNNFIMQGFDADMVLFLLNAGYSYKIDFESSAYIGLGYGTFFQIQYGYAYSQKKDLLRLRSDIPMTITNTKSVLGALSLGIYWERRFDDIEHANNYGINISIGLMNLFWSLR